MRLQSARALALLSRRIARARRRIVARVAISPRVSRGARRSSPSAPTIRPRRGATSPTAAPSPACMRASPRPARELDHVVALRQPIVDPPPYASAGEFGADLDVDRASLKATGGAILARGRLRALRRAVDVFGFHLAPIDLRQNSDVHERTVAELFAAVAPGPRLSQRSTRRSASRCCAGSCARRARWSRRSSPIARRRPGELALFRTARGDPRKTTAPAPSAPGSSRRPTASPTCWSWRCC